MKINHRRRVVRRLVCPSCGEPARWCPPRGPIGTGVPRPRYSHRDRTPLCPVMGPDGLGPGVPVPAPPRSRRRATPAVFVVAGGDMVAVFDNPDAAETQALVMFGANLDPITRQLPPARWDEARAILAARHPEITIVDVRRSGAAS